MKIERNISLKDKTTFNVGGFANYYAEANSIADLEAAVAYAKALNAKIFILGGGSNILVSDHGFKGMVIKNNFKGIRFSEYPKTVDVTVAAGEIWDEAVEKTVEKGLAGLENLSLIPGTAGGAIVQNIGAYGSEIKDTVLSVEVFDTRTGEVRKMSREACRFDYRNSFFKSAEGRNYVIVSTTLCLQKNAFSKIIYKDLVDYFSKENIKNPTLREVREAVIEIRMSKLPDLKVFGTAGSFFKNPTVSSAYFEKLKKHYPDMPGFFLGYMVKIPLAWIVDKICDLKGYRSGNAGIYEKQAIVLVNHGNAMQKDIDDVAEYIEKAVFEKTGIKVEREVEYVIG